MKINQLAVGITLILAATLFCSAAKRATASITGIIDPPYGVSTIRAVSTTDTLEGSISDGNFEIKNVKPGTYHLEVKAVAPYKDATKSGVVITGSNSVDVGEILLGQ
jgi:hypothetical protein